MESIIKHILEMTLYSSAMLLTVMTIKVIFNNKIHIKIISFLWIIVLIRMLIPFTFDSSWHIDSLFPDKAENSVTIHSAQQDEWVNDINTDITPDLEYQVPIMPDVQPDNIIVTDTIQTETTNPMFIDKVFQELLSFSIWEYSFIVWVIGMTVFLLRNVYYYIGFSKKLKKCQLDASFKVGNIVKEQVHKLRISKKIMVRLCRYVDVPITIGWIKPQILIPINFEKDIEHEKQKLIITHELLHIKRNDILKNYLWLIAKTVHWFNPLVLIAYKEYVEDVELAVDTRIIESGSAITGYLYSQSIVDVIRVSKRYRSISPLAMSFCRDKDKIRKRVENMLQPARKLKSAGVISILLAMIMVVGCFTTACQPTPEEIAVSSKQTDIEQVVIQNKDNEQKNSQETTDNSAEQQNQPKEADPTKTEYYQTSETYTNQFSQANVEVIVDAKIYGPRDNKIVSVVLEDKKVTQELANDFISYFTGDVQLYEKKSNHRSKEEIDEEITYWKQIIFNCETKWDEVHKNDPYADYDNSADAIDGFNSIIRHLEQDKKAAPDKVEYRERNREFEDNQIIAYAQNTQGSFKDMAFIIISDRTSSSKSKYLGSLLYDNKGSWRDSELTLDEVYADSGLTLEYALEQASITAQHFGINELALDWYSVHRHFKDGKMVPFLKLRLTPSINSIGSPMLFDATGLGFSAVSMMSPAPTPETIDVCVDAEGIIEYSWMFPKNITKTIDDDVKIMSFDEVIDIFEQKIFYTLYTDGQAEREIHIKRIELSLMPIKKKNSTQTVFVPVWDFRGYFFDPTDELWANSGNVRNETTISSFLTINAIDGSIVSRELGY